MRDILLIDKPRDCTSYDVIRILKRKLRGTKMGHAGTLDPMATGLLIILLGTATKKFAEFQKLPKEYVAEISFGAKTDTWDADGKIIFECNQPFRLEAKVLKVLLDKMHGEILQQPPIYSALKVDGVRAYKTARRGGSPELQPRKAHVYAAEILGIGERTAKILFRVSSGTYIRSLASELGEQTGYGAYLSALRRTKIGEYKVEDAKLPEEIDLE